MQGSVRNILLNRATVLGNGTSGVVLLYRSYLWGSNIIIATAVNTLYVILCTRPINSSSLYQPYILKSHPCSVIYKQVLTYNINSIILVLCNRQDFCSDQTSHVWVRFSPEHKSL